jgi:hypothetical protein
MLPGVVSNEGARLGEEAARRFVRSGRYEIGPGLTDEEFARIERDYNLEFADDHRAFLAAGLPLNGPRKKGQTWVQPWRFDIEHEPFPGAARRVAVPVG